MATSRQIAANTRNAKKSTGPRTAAGKSRVSMNASKHGLTGAKHIVLPGEDPEAFATFEDGLFESLNPQDALEAECTRQLAADLWRLRRIPVIEAAVFAQAAHQQREAAARLPKAQPNGLTPGTQQEMQQIDLGKIMTGLLQHGVIDKLTRYQLSLHRQVLARFKQLEELQARHTIDLEPEDTDRGATDAGEPAAIGRWTVSGGG